MTTTNPEEEDKVVVVTESERKIKKQNKEEVEVREKCIKYTGWVKLGAGRTGLIYTFILQILT